MLIFRRSNCIVTASGFVTLRKQLPSAPVESGLQWRVWQELEYLIDVCRVNVVHTSKNSRCQKNFFSSPVAVNYSIKVGPLVFLL